jgi:Outer membrane protein beta-barrel domain
MSWSVRNGFAAVVLLGLMIACRGEAVVVPPSPGQVGFGVQGEYGALLKSGGFGSDFGSGPGLTVRLRYRMRYERGLGLSFESQRFDVREAATADTAINRLSIFTAGLEFYQMFGTRTRTSRMVSVGAGLAKASVKLNNDETTFPTGGDGVYVSAGLGVERFFWQAWAYDLSGRYMTVFHDGKANHDLQIALGLIFYSGY